MKRWLLHTSLSIIGVSVIIGCGGGESNGTGVTAKLTDANIDKLGDSVARALPGCVYISNTEVAFADEYLTFLKAISDDMKHKKIFSKMPGKQKTTISRVENGSCGGTVLIEGIHDNGDDDLIYAYSNYCIGDAAGDRTVINGSTKVVKDGTPSASGPILDSISVSTQGTGISANTIEDGVTKAATLVIDDFKWTKSGTTTITKLKVVSEDKAYTLSGVNTEYNKDDGTMKIKSATYTDPEVGAVDISSNMMSDGAPATITVRGTEGVATFESSSTNTKKFFASNEDGEPIGAIDCSGVDNPL